MDIFPEYFLYSNVNIYQYGEKGHVEYGWSDNLREKILQWNFQAIRCEEEKKDKLETIYSQLIQDLFTIYKYRYVKPIDKEICFYFLIILYKMVGQVRDLVEGKGEYSIAYRMVYAWYLICPELSFFALESFVSRKDLDQPYGSWKDIKYFCNFLLKNKRLPKDHELIQYAIKLMNHQLRKDEWNNQNNPTKSISLVAKWIPREKSFKFSWLNDLLAIDYYSFYTKSCSIHNLIQQENAIKKAKMNYRKLISKLNKFCETIEIKQCENDWKSINFQKVTSIGLYKKSASFLNDKNKKEKDRLLCANYFKKFIEEKEGNNKEKIKGKNICLGEFTKKAQSLLKLDQQNENTLLQIKLLNEQWINHSKNTFPLEKMIAIIDISPTMTEEATNLAIAIGIRIAEKSSLGKRILLFGSKFPWINLESLDTFTSIVNKINQVKQMNWCIQENIYSSMDLILHAMIQVKMDNKEMKDLILVIISDMQIDSFQKNQNNLYWEIKQKFNKKGIQFYGKELSPPSLLFWNVQNTNGFPCLWNQDNCFMISGNHPSLLNFFKDEIKKPSFQAPTPWSTLIKSLENKRYKIMETKGKECL